MLEPNPRDTDSSSDAPWGFFESIPPMQLILLGITLVFMEQLVLGLLNPVLPSLHLAVLIAVVLVFFLVPGLVIRRSGAPLSSTLRLFPLSGPQIGWTLLAAVALVLPVNALGEWNLRFITPPPEFDQLMEDLRPEGAWWWALATFTVVLVVPIGEEIVFRGLIQQTARDQIPGLWAAVLVGALFGVLHFEPWYVLGLTAMGVAMGLAFEFTGSLWAAILVHVVYNAIALATFLVPDDFDPALLDSSGPGTTLALASALVAGWALLRLSRSPSRFRFLTARDPGS